MAAYTLTCPTCKVSTKASLPFDKASTTFKCPKCKSEMTMTLDSAQGNGLTGTGWIGHLQSPQPAQSTQSTQGTQGVQG